MAQALFEEHPLEEYLRESGEFPLLMPGTSSELEQELDPNFGLFDDTSDELLADWCPPIFLQFLELLQSAAALPKSQSTSSKSFVERFKYNVISSSLLELSLPTLHHERIRRSPHIPGTLGHSRASSMDLDRPVSPSSTPLSSEPSYGSISLAALLTAIFFSIGYHSLALISMIAALFFVYTVISTTETSKHDMTSSLNALDDLVAANDTWDSVVQDAMTFLDNEDNNLHRSSRDPSSPSPIRVALHSCLQMTHTQCDNVRHLFSALTSPTHLSQLSEMYAPPSPAYSAFDTSPRPLSISSPHPTSPPTSQSITPQNKRSTWNGSYSSLAFSGSPTKSIYRRRQRRQSNLLDVFQPRINSAPTSPFVGTSLPAQNEEPEEPVLDELGSSTTNQFPSLPAHFGAAALDLQRKRRSGGMEAFRTPPANYFSADLRSPPSARSSLFTSASKFTNVQPSRHPLLYSSLNHSLQGALAAKRYACSHLLALRFGDEEDEGYWEDVRSVMGLLSSALIDSFSMLTEALVEMEQQNLRDSNPTPVMANFDTSEGDLDNLVHADEDNAAKWQKSANRVSFAPMPSTMSRFAAHIAAISSALEDAREHLDQCVSALKEDSSSSTNSSPLKRLRHSRSASMMLSTGPDVEESQALQAYERLRRELGLALRECERGRGRLLDIINPPIVPSDEEEEFDDLPGLGHDASDDSDKADPASPYDDEAEAAALAAANGFRPSVVNAEGVEAEGALIDDATPHLLLATSTQHLPLPGIEEVFEADTGAKAAFSRERSRLSREERIKIAKARRESGMGLSIGLGATTALGEEAATGSLGGVEKWGPGGEVVQELKDVIWKVGERRRKMTTAPPSSQVDVPSEAPPEPTQPADTLESL